MKFSGVYELETWWILFSSAFNVPPGSQYSFPRSNGASEDRDGGNFSDVFPKCSSFSLCRFFKVLRQPLVDTSAHTFSISAATLTVPLSTTIHAFVPHFVCLPVPHYYLVQLFSMQCACMCATLGYPVLACVPPCVCVCVFALPHCIPPSICASLLLCH